MTNLAAQYAADTDWLATHQDEPPARPAPRGPQIPTTGPWAELPDYPSGLSDEEPF